jgi:hypothetical protein
MKKAKSTLLILFLALSACAGSWQNNVRKGLIASNEAMNATNASSKTYFDDKCMRHAVGCKDKLEGECDALKHCQSTRRNLNDYVIAAKFAIADALALVEVAEEEKDMTEVLKRVQETTLKAFNGRREAKVP